MKELRNFGYETERKHYIIAEIGINHGGSIETAKELIDSAVRSGADAVKFQTYITEKRVAKDSPIFDILKKCELSFDDFAEIKNYCDAKNITFFSTPFDDESLDFLESVGCALYKVASFDLVNLSLLRKIAATGKPVIMSVGMSDIEEIKKACEILRTGTGSITLLHCISAYPTNEEDANLGAIYELIKEFPYTVIGQSDHTNGIKVPLYALAAGAQVLEKHYKLDDTMDCIDGVVSITEKQMKELVEESMKIEKIFGIGKVGLTAAQKDIVQYRRRTD